MGQDGRRRDYLFFIRSCRPRLIPMHFIRSMLAALAALAAPVLLSASASAFENRVDARLLVETDRLDPGKSTRIALKLSPQQGWHVYWSNPGDSGMPPRSEEHTSELQSLMRISYAVFCLKTKISRPNHYTSNHIN